MLTPPMLARGISYAPNLETSTQTLPTCKHLFHIESLTEMDPLSLSAGAAGFISLGISVCNSLVTYCRDYRSRDNDLDLLGQHADRLHAIVRGLGHRVCPPAADFATDPSLAGSIQQCLDACDVCIRDFKALKRKYSTGNNGTRARGKATLRQLAYPFQKEKFESLRAEIRAFHSALSSYLLLLNL